MSPWSKFYSGRGGESYRQYVRDRYAPFIGAIADRIGYDSHVLEIGAGTGTITSILADYNGHDNQRFCATDVDPEMVKATKCRLEALGLDAVSVFTEDAIGAQHPTQADIVHSHGMLEHFDDDTIRKVIENYREHAYHQVHYVPGLYPEPTFGDERLMPVDAWWRICKPVGLSQIITFNEGLDYALVFE